MVVVYDDGYVAAATTTKGFALSFSLLSLTLSSLCDRQAIKRDSFLASKVKKIVVLDGAFFVLGNVNPAAEANYIQITISCEFMLRMPHGSMYMLEDDNNFQSSHATNEWNKKVLRAPHGRRR
ncbi:Uridine nucleosidase 1 [Trifolium repens]|nr:Uridine nucleosidase 1 [Trifolium repens]